MIIFLSIILALVTFAMSMAILLQEPKQAGLGGSFGMGGDQMLGAGSPNALSKFTGFLSVGFLVLCLAIGMMSKSSAGRSNIKTQEGDTTGVSTSISPEAGTNPGELGTDPSDTVPGNTGVTDPGTGDPGTGNTDPGTGEG